MTKKLGRPSRYRKEFAEQAYKLTLLGAIDNELADFFEIGAATLNRWKLEHPDFRESITRGKMAADGNVAERLYQRALGYSHEAVKIFMPTGAEAPVYAPYTEHYPPDTQAALRWLQNRQPAKWREPSRDGEGGVASPPGYVMVPATAESVDAWQRAAQQQLKRDEPRSGDPNPDPKPSS